eukprot:TRINITY_DN10108_c0_g1_i1.p1 TRINITY_DN10108_c0_g1~~TRINITY_DN10108_c0_g1_i1.p1  ORF type:complete len:356 (+),score=88.97 TRINITY_DN10108_c0_g1_i1:143-1210(+)
MCSVYYLCCLAKEDNQSGFDDVPYLDEAATTIQKHGRGMLARKRHSETRVVQIEEEKAAWKAAANRNTKIVEDLADEVITKSKESMLMRGSTISRMMTLEVLSATGLRNVVGRRFRGNQSTCPFVVCTMGSVHVKTNVLENTVDPVWNESFQIIDPDASYPMTFRVFHPARGKKAEILLGIAELDCVSLGFDGELELSQTGLKNSTATLQVNINWTLMQPLAVSGDLNNVTAVRWIVRYRALGLRTGPGAHTERVGIDLSPGEEFDVVEVIEGAKDQRFLRLKDGRGWAFTMSPKDGEILAVPLDSLEMLEEELSRRSEEVQDRFQIMASKAVSWNWLLGGKASNSNLAAEKNSK